MRNICLRFIGPFLFETTTVMLSCLMIFLNQGYMSLKGLMLITDFSKTKPEHTRPEVFWWRLDALFQRKNWENCMTFKVPWPDSPRLLFVGFLMSKVHGTASYTMRDLKFRIKSQINIIPEEMLAAVFCKLEVWISRIVARSGRYYDHIFTK